MRLLRRLGLVVLCVLAFPSAALAHANLVGSEPRDGAVLASPPAQVRLFFDDDVRTQPGMRAVRNAGGSVLAGTPRVVHGRELVIPLRRGLRRGAYTILWRALSDDGHVIGGVTTFAVGLGSAPPKPALKAPGTQDASRVAARWLFLAGVLVAAGAALFTLIMGLAAAPPAGLFAAGFFLAAAGSLVLYERASSGTRFGLTVAAAAGVALLGLATSTLALRWIRLLPAAVVLGLLLLPAPSASGHALDPGRPPFEVVVDLAHVAAASLWVGGLLSLVIALRAGRIEESLLRRFSTVALLSVVVLGVTGVVRALAELTSVGQLWGTGYGRLLIVKTGILAALVGLGWVNRYRLIPAGSRSWRALRRNVSAEVVLFAGLVVAVAFLTQARPGRDRLRLPVAAAAPAPPAPEESAGSVVLGQRPGQLELAGNASSAVLVGGRSLVWETVAGEEGGTATLVERDLRSRRTRVLAKDVASQYGLAAAARWVVYARSSGAGQPVLVLRRGGRRQVLSPSLSAPIAWRGHRLAWAEQVSGRQRVVVLDVTHGRRWIAADLPTCEGRRCYRIDRVTLADEGVVFDRGAIGPQPSVVFRRAFSAPKSESVSIAHDPQPDLVPFSDGALYYALGRGWYRWPFGQAQPERVLLQSPAAAQPLRNEHGRWTFRLLPGCKSALATGSDAGPGRVLIAPARVRAAAGVGRGFCVYLAGSTWAGNNLVTTWQVLPEGTHASGPTSVVLVDRAQ